jgi:hypothetical protein
LRNSVRKVLANIRASFEVWTENSFAHFSTALSDSPHEKESCEIGSQLCQGESWHSHFGFIYKVVAHKGMYTDCNTHSDTRNPEILVAIDKSTVDVSNAPEEKGW